MLDAGILTEKRREIEWRDLLLSVFDLSGDRYKSTQFEAVRLLESFPGDSLVGEVLIRRLQTEKNPLQEATSLPIVLGEKSVPHLISGMERFRDNSFVLGTIMEALVKATGQFLTLDGKAHPIIESELYKENQNQEELIPQWETWWKEHRSQYQSRNLLLYSKRPLARSLPSNSYTVYFFGNTRKEEKRPSGAGCP